MTLRRELHEANRLSWNAATRAHNSHKRDQAGFLRSGGSTLFPDECELLGDITGQRLVHLMCNAGQDTLSLAARGAEVTGVDISDEAIAFAQQLSNDSGIAGKFERADVYDWLAAEQARFDVAFTSYGALCWLSDLPAFARALLPVLVPGGRYVALDFHPLADVFDEKLVPRFSYFSNGDPYSDDEGIWDYVARSDSGLTPSGYEEGEVGFSNPHPCHEFPRSLAEIVQAFVDAGFQLELLREYPYSNGCRFFDLLQMDAERRWRWPPGHPAIPLMYGLVLRRPALQSG